MFSSKGFIVSGLTFKCLIHFEFIFVYGVRKCSNFMLLHHTAELERGSTRFCFSSPRWSLGNWSLRESPHLAS